MFDRMVGVPSLQECDFQTLEELDRFKQHMDAVVIPEIVKQVQQRERNAVEARKIFIFGNPYVHTNHPADCGTDVLHHRVDIVP